MRDVCNCPRLLICANIRVAPRSTPATEKQFAEAQGLGRRHPYFRPRLLSAVARRRDVTGSKAWDRLRRGEASPP